VKQPTSPRLGQPISVLLPFTPPLFPDNLFGHLVATAAPGVEEWRDGAFRCSFRLPHGHAVAALRPRPDHVAATVWLSDARDRDVAVRRCRRMLDLDVDPTEVQAVLEGDPVLAPLVRRAPGRRVPGSVDAAGFAVRAVLGQQVSTAAARTLAGRLVAGYGEPIDDPDGGLTHLFPTPAALVDLDPTALAMPATRRATLLGLVRALADGTVVLDPDAAQPSSSSRSASSGSASSGSVADARVALAALQGIGPWTVEMIAMRGLGDCDAFVATDLGVRQSATTLGLPASPRELRRRSLAWQPYRAHAVQYLWAVGDHAVNRMPA
jgi:AraC family transcriptional regulator, regulatory protein of adaptative response / DNA-3-methyladenine glycosylase II